MNSPVYEVRVTLKGRPALVPMTVVDLGPASADSSLHLFTVGYVMPSGHHKRYNVPGNVRWYTEEQAVDQLFRLAKERGWKLWPEGRPQECIYLDKED